MSDWKEGIWIALSALLVSVFIMFLHTVGTAVRESAKIEQSNMNNVEVLKEYYKTGRYDDTIVTQADVVNCIYESRGKYAVYATSYTTADNYTAVTYDCIWNGSTAAPWYELNNISSILPPDKKYRAFLIKDASGAITGFQFKRIS